MAKTIETVCSLCPTACVMTVTFDDQGNVLTLTGDQCDSGKEFVQNNKEMLLTQAK